MDTPPIEAVDGVLAENTYGKSRVRLMKLARRADRHDLKEITLQILFRGDFASAYETGDNSKILPTDTIKNTVYAMARRHDIDSIEVFAERLIDHFLKNNPQVAEVRVEMTEHLWSRIAPAAFTRDSQKRTALVTGTREGVTFEAGIDDLTILKSSGSGFEGYIKDPVHDAEGDERPDLCDGGARGVAIRFGQGGLQRALGSDPQDDSRYVRGAREPLGAAYAACHRPGSSEEVSGRGRDRVDHAEQARAAGRLVAVRTRQSERSVSADR